MADEPTAGTTEAAPEAAPVESNWRDGLSEENSKDASLADFKGVDQLATAYRSTKQMIGKSLRPPGPDASPEDHAAFRQDLLDRGLGLTQIPDDVEGRMELYRQMGLPEDATGYDPIEGLEEGRFKRISELAHQNGVSREQFSAVLGPLVASDIEILNTQNGERSAGIDALKKDWGDAYTDKAARVRQFAAITDAPAKLLAHLDSATPDADTLKWLDGVAGEIGSEGQQLANDIGSVIGETRDELIAQKGEITKRLVNPDTNLTDAEVKRLNAKRLDINRRLQ
ncbi:MAG: hypothetical protein GY764_01190 [Halieaceae bacterium]|nr:hypothetical protein [Halieaceae bacterium]